MRVVNSSLLLVALALFASFINAANESSTTVEPGTTATPVSTQLPYVPFNATNDSGAAAAATFFTIGGIIIIAQIIYCIVWTKRDREERAKFNAEIEDAGLVGGSNTGSQIDMKGNQQHSA